MHRTGYPDVRPYAPRIKPWSILLGPALLATITLLAAIRPAAAEMSRETSISAGSFFAAAATCERHGEILTGQVAPMMKDIDKHLSRNNRHWIAEGYRRGFEKAAVYIPDENKKEWIPFTVGSDECERVQGVLDEYKAILAPLRTETPAK